MRYGSVVSVCLLVACGGDGRQDDGFVTIDPSTSNDGGTATNDDDTPTSTTPTEGTTSNTTTPGDETNGPLFDVGGRLDVEDTGDGPIIPETCDQASQAETTVGCLFYAVDLDQNGPLESDQYAVAVSNVQTATDANVTIEQKVAGMWEPVPGMSMVVAPLSLHSFPLPDKHQQSSGVQAGGSYRVVSDVPIIAYQFNPLVMGSYSSDASMLYPVTSWDSLNHVIHWGGGYGLGYVTIVAAEDGTQVEVTPTVATQAGPGVPAGTPGVPFMISLDQGDIAEVMVTTENTQLTGTRIASDETHPISVFSGHECAWIPHTIPACDHIEDQLSGVRLWGQRFVAARMPVRETMAAPAPETTLWQIYASEDDTTITLTAHADVTGLPASPTVLDAGQHLEFYASGTFANPGDFLVEADKAIAVVAYMIGEANLTTSTLGDPAMVQLSPVEQFLPRYVVLVASDWEIDQFVITRAAGSSVSMDGAVIDDALFVPVGAEFEVARIPAADGVHMLEGELGFSVVVVGYDSADSYAYLGGSSTGKINPNPEG